MPSAFCRFQQLGPVRQLWVNFFDEKPIFNIFFTQTPRKHPKYFDKPIHDHKNLKKP